MYWVPWKYTTERTIDCLGLGGRLQGFIECIIKERIAKMNWEGLVGICQLDRVRKRVVGRGVSLVKCMEE